MLTGSVSCLSKLITITENDSNYIPEIMNKIYSHLGKAFCIGVTGAPGVGKSSLISSLTTIVRGHGFSVGILAADPSSLIHGGAVLGDRLRMQQHFLDSKVYIRSMATRGNQGGLPKSTGNVIKLLDAFGKDIIFVETVGVGQTEIGIAEIANIILLVLSPESGDSIQFMKAGIMEIADLIVVNKCDRSHSNEVISGLKSYLSVASNKTKNKTDILATDAIDNIGIEELYDKINKRHKSMKNSETKKTIIDKISNT